MKQELWKKALICITSIVVILGLLYLGFFLRIDSVIDLQTTYVASHNIPPRSRVMEEDIMEIQIPKAYLQNYTFNKKEDIIGKYTDIQGKIPAGSCFYEGMLIKEDELPDYPSSQLRGGQAAYTLETDLARIGGSVIAGQRVDLHVSIDRRGLSPITGYLFENVRLIAIKDHKGLDLEDENSTGIPYLAILAINQEDVPILTLAEQLGEIRLFSSSATYDSTKEAMLLDNSDVYQELVRMEQQVSE